MMKKFSFKSIAFLMSLIMIFSIVAPVCASAAEWAHDDHKHEKEGPINYVSIGDSMVNGYGLPGYYSDGGVLDYGFESYTNRFAAYLAGLTDAEFDALVSAAIEGDLDFGKVFTGANGTVNHSQLAMSAMRIEDIHWLLEVNLEDPAVVALLNEIGVAYATHRGWDADLNEKWHNVFSTGDAWVYNELLARRLMNAAHQINHANGVTTQQFGIEAGEETGGQENVYCQCFWNEYGTGAVVEAVRVVSDYYKAAVAEADVISLGLGNGNFGVFLFNAVIQAMANPAVADLYSLEAAMAEYNETQKNAANDIINALMPTIEKFVGGNIKGMNSEAAEAVIDVMLYAVVSFAINYNGAIDAIVRLNPDVEIIEVGLSNTYAGDEKFAIKDENGKSDMTLGQLLDLVFPYLNEYIAGIAAGMQAGSDVYAEAKIYYAEEYSLECLVSTYKTEEFYSNRSVARDRFVKYISGNLFGLMPVALAPITLAEVEAYEALETAAEKAMYPKAASVEVYLAFENAIAISSNTTAVTLPALTLMAGGGDVVSLFTPVLTYYGANAEAYALAAAPVASEAIAQIINATLAANGIAVEIFTAEDVTAMMADFDNRANVAYDVIADCEEADAIIEAMAKAKATELSLDWNTMNNGMKLAVIGMVEGTIADMVAGALNVGQYTALCTLFSAYDLLNDALLSDEMVKVLLGVLGRNQIGNGLGAHPSTKGHKALADAVIEAYDEGHTATDETIANLKDYANIAYKDAFAKYGYKLDEVVAYVDDAIEAVKAAKDAVDAAVADNNQKTYIMEEFDNTIATLEAIKAAIEGLEGETYEEVFAALLLLEGELDKHLATIDALVLSMGNDVVATVSPYLARLNDALNFYADVIDAIVEEAYARAQAISGAIAGINDAYLGFVEYVGSVADMLDPALGAAVRAYLIDTPADVFAIVYAYGEEAVIKLIVDAANAGGEMYDVILGFAALVDAYGKEIFDILEHSEYYDDLIAAIQNAQANLEAAARRLNEANEALAKIYADIEKDAIIKDKIAKLEAELKAVEEQILNFPASTDYEAVKAALNAKIEALVRELTYEYEAEAQAAIAAAEAEVAAAQADLLARTDALDELYTAVYNLFMDTAEDISPLAEAMLKDSIAALLECLGIIENAGVNYSAWLGEHFAPLAGELIASIVANSEELYNVAAPIFEALLEMILKTIEDYADAIIDELEIMYEEIKAEIEAELAELYKALEELNSELERLGRKLAELYAKLEVAVGEAKKAIEAEIERVKAEIEKIMEAIEELEAEIQKLIKKLAEIKAQIDEAIVVLKAVIADIKEAIAVIREVLAELDAIIKEITDAIIYLNDLVETNGGIAVEYIKALVAELRAIFANTNMSIRDVLTHLQNFIAGVKGAIEDIQNAIEYIKDSIDEIKAAIEDIKAVVAALKVAAADIKEFFEANKGTILAVIETFKDAKVWLENLYELIAPSLSTDYDRNEDSYYVAIGNGASEGYAALLAEKLGVDAGVLAAELRVSDLRAILDAAYVNDAYGLAYIDDETRELLAAVYAEEIAKADLITLDLGNADFTSFVTNQLSARFVELNKAEFEIFETLMNLMGMEFDLDAIKTYDLDWSRFEEIEKYVDVKATLAAVEEELIASGIPAEYVYETSLSELLYMMTGEEIDLSSVFSDDSIEVTVYPADLMMYAVECYLYAAASYAYNYAAVIEAIHAINPDAEVVVLGTFNALEGLIIDLGDGDVLNVSDFAEGAVAALNAMALANVVSIEKTTFVDVSDVETLVEEDGVVEFGEYIVIDILNMAVGFNSDAFTPTEAGNEYIVAQILAALRLTCAHAYTDDCDAVCNICGEEREVADHVYDNDCDADCNVCGEERTPAEHVYDNDCDATCNVCNAERDVADHVYSNACDTTCNVCGAERDVADHVYSNACDADCNVCGATRTVGEHVYTNACDADCNECGATRTPAQHAYDNACDTTCNECGATRTVGEHVYTNNCDADCNECGATRTPADHVYDNSCDANCNVCDAERAVDGHLFGEWVVVEEATADKEGLKKHTCLECGAEETEAIAKLAPVTTTPADDDSDDDKKPVNAAVIVVIVVVAVAGVGTGVFFVLKKFSIL